MWAVIGVKSRTSVCVLDGVMDAEAYVTENATSVHQVYPDHHRFMQDNDPKHTSRRARELFEEHRINWWQTPPESPDLNPIENLWHELRVFVEQSEADDQLVSGINQFWETVTPVGMPFQRLKAHFWKPFLLLL